MNITYACPQCDATCRQEISESDASLTCPHCTLSLRVPDDAFDAGKLRRCLVCPSTDLFLRKDFPQRLGLMIVVLGFAASTLAWGMYHTYLSFAILFAVAFVDVLLYATVKDSLMCYRCKAEYRGVEGTPDHGRFELETHERYRQEAARRELRAPQSRSTVASPPVLESPAADSPPR